MESKEGESKLNRVEYLPLCTERKSDISSSIRTFHIKVANIDGLNPTSHSESYHIQAILFDQKYGCFVGSSWNGKHNFYFYTSIPIKDLLLVIELITPSKLSNGFKTCGWMCLPLLKSEDEDTSDKNTLQYKVPLVQGSPLSLIVNKKLRNTVDIKKLLLILMKQCLKHPDFSSNASIIQRRLQVAVYNGYRFIQDSDIYHLHIEPPATPTASKNLRRASSMGALSGLKEESLVLRSDIKLAKIPDDDNIAIVFLLEYVISLPSTKEDKQNIPSSLNKTPTSSVAVVWGFCYLGTLKENPAQNIILTCDPTLSPHKILFLKIEQPFEMTFSAFSLLKQNKSSPDLYLSDNHASTINNSNQSETSVKTSYFQPALGHSTPKHKSVADIPMTVQHSRIDYPQKVITNPGSSKNENNLALQEVTLVPSSLPLVPPLLHSFPLEPGEAFKSFTKIILG
ncbi:nephrocystin-4 [Caerostris extrusa]|uniref:Nephrocystin-4 n=1 Tax=Caerostris extrusa TaxID=172846 RepID=A0AAV4T2B9_CAEEX|nr:nephrocystin-4 [Caerostris extrusa]